MAKECSNTSCSKESCEGCPFEGECCKSKKHRKIVSRDAVDVRFILADRSHFILY